MTSFRECHVVKRATGGVFGMGYERLTTKEQHEQPERVVARIRVQFLLHTRHATQGCQIELGELLGSRPRALEVKPPMTPIGEDAPTNASLRGDLDGGEVAQDLVGWRSRVESISLVSAI